MSVLDKFISETTNGKSIEFTVAWRANNVDVYPGNQYDWLVFNKSSYEYKAIRVYRFGLALGKTRRPNKEELSFIYNNLDDVIFMSDEQEQYIYGSLLFN